MPLAPLPRHIRPTLGHPSEDRGRHNAIRISPVGEMCTAGTPPPPYRADLRTLIRGPGPAQFIGIVQWGSCVPRARLPYRGSTLSRHCFKGGRHSADIGSPWRRHLRAHHADMASTALIVRRHRVVCVFDIASTLLRHSVDMAFGIRLVGGCVPLAPLPRHIRPTLGHPSEDRGRHNTIR